MDADHPHKPDSLYSGVRSLDLPLLDPRLFSFATAGCPPELAGELGGRPASLLTMTISLPFKLLVTKLRLHFSKDVLLALAPHIHCDSVFRFVRARYQLDGVLQGGTGFFHPAGFTDLNFQNPRVASPRELELTGTGIASSLQLQFLYAKRLPVASPRSQTAGEAVAALTAEQSSEYDEFDEEVAMISQTRRQKPPPAANASDPPVEVDDIKLLEQPQPKKRPERQFNTLPKDYDSLQQLPSSSQAQPGEDPGSFGLTLLGPEDDPVARLKDSLEGTTVWGLSTQQTQYASNVIPLLNYIAHLKSLLATTPLHSLYLNELIEAEQINALALISSRRYIQAAELLRHIQGKILKSLPPESSTDPSSSRSQISPRFSGFFAGVNRQRAGGAAAANTPQYRLLQRAAKLELLVADCTKRHGFVHEKLLSLRRFCELSQGSRVPPMAFKMHRVYMNEDPVPALQKLHPRLVRALLKVLGQEGIEQVRIAALKTLDYLLEQLGCSLDSYLIYTLRAIVKHYPRRNGMPGGAQSLFNTSIISSNSSSDLLSARSQPGRRGSTQLEDDYYAKFIDTNQAFGQLMQGLFNHLLETLLLVLSSVSSQILHQMFYEIITPYVASGALEDAPSELQNYVLKLAEKMINICQGDLLFSPQFLTALLLLMRFEGKREAISAAAFALWQVIRMKVLPNYPIAGLDALIEWFAQNLFLLSQGGEGRQAVTFADEGGPPTPTEDLAKLNIILDAITTVARGSAFEDGQETGGSLIIFPKTTHAELYELINPLLYWLFFSIERESRLPLFKSVWSAITSILRSLPASVSPSINQIAQQLLARVEQFCRTSSPSRSMLRFCDIVLGDIREPNQELVRFLNTFLETFCECVPSSVFEETFHVVDHLLRLCSLLGASLISRLVDAFVHKYTLRSKTQSTSLSLFLACMLNISLQPGIGRPYFETLLRVLLIDNCDNWELVEEEASGAKFDLKQLQTEREAMLEKLRIFLKLLGSAMEIEHAPLFLQLLQSREAHAAILRLLGKSESAVKIKAHEILEAMAAYFQKHLASVSVTAQQQLPQTAGAPVLSGRNRGSMQSGQSANMLTPTSSHESGSLLPALRPASGNSFTDAPIQAQDLTGGMQVIQEGAGRLVTHERLLLVQLFIKVAKASLEQGSAQGDSSLQFSALILLDTLFQSIMPAPGYEMEVGEGPLSSSRSPGRRIQRAEIIDLEQADLFTETLAYDVGDARYLNIRMLSILKFWPFVEAAIQSPWSNVRSICYGLVCSMLKVDLHDYRSSYQQRIRNLYQPLLLALLSGKESESKAGGLNILGSICGLSHDFSSQESLGAMLGVFRRNSEFISMPLWQQVYDLQDDWDVTIREAAVVLTQLSAPRELVRHFEKAKQENIKINLNRIINKHRGDWQLAHFEEPSRPALVSRGSSACSYISLLDIQPGFSDTRPEDSPHESPPPPDTLFFVDRYNESQVREIISIFRNDFKPPKNLWIERTERDSPDSVENTFSAEYASGEAQMVLSPTREIEDSPRANRLSEKEILEIAEEFQRSEEKVIGEEEEEEKSPSSSSSPGNRSQQQPPLERMPSGGSTEEEDLFPEDMKTEQLIFEEYRQPPPEPTIDAEPFTILSAEEEDELGIIELGDDQVFENLDDKNIPVLRNSYANSRRPRKSKGRPSSAKQPQPKHPMQALEVEVGGGVIPEEDEEEKFAEPAMKVEDNEKEKEKEKPPAELSPQVKDTTPPQQPPPAPVAEPEIKEDEETKEQEPQAPKEAWVEQKEKVVQPAPAPQLKKHESGDLPLKRKTPDDPHTRKAEDSLDDLIIKTELFDFEGNELKLKEISPKREHRQTAPRSQTPDQTREGGEELGAAEVSPVFHSKKKSTGSAEAKALSPPIKRKPKSSSVPKPNHQRYPPKSARDYTPSNARLFKEINACFSVKEDPLPLTARIPKQSKKQQSKKGTNKSELSGSVLSKLQKAFKQINTTLSPKRERKNNSLERLNAKRHASRELYSNKDVNYFVKKFEAQMSKPTGSVPSTPTMATSQPGKDVRSKKPLKLPPSALQYHKESAQESLSNTSPNIGAVLQRLNLEEELSSPNRKPASMVEEDADRGGAAAAGHFVASPQFYSQKRIQRPQIVDFYSVRPQNVRMQQQLYHMIEKETAHRAKKGAKRAKKQPQQLKKDSSGARIQRGAPGEAGDPNMTF